MNLEERVLAIKAKFQEAANELLDLVSESPSAVGDIMQIAAPQERKSDVTVRRIVETCITRGDATYGDRFEIPNVFMEFSRRHVRHETDPVDVLVPSGEVYLSVGIWPENEIRTDAIRKLTAGTISGEEYQRLIQEANEQRGIYETWGDDPELGG